MFSKFTIRVAAGGAQAVKIPDFCSQGNRMVLAMAMAMAMAMGNMLLWKHINIGLLGCFPISAISKVLNGVNLMEPILCQWCLDPYSHQVLFSFASL